MVELIDALEALAWRVAETGSVSAVGAAARRATPSVSDLGGLCAGLSAEDQFTIEQAIERARGGESSPLQLTLASPGGPPLRLRGRALRDEDGVLLVLADVSAGERALSAVHDAETRLSDFVENLPFAFWACDATGRCIAHNRVFGRTWGGDMVGRRLDELSLDEATRARWRGCFERAMQGEVVRLERQQQVGDELRTLLTIVAPVRAEGRVVGIEGINLDITDRQALEDQRARLLAEESRARSAAEAAVRMRDEFLAVASHELRTPLAALQLGVEALARLHDAGDARALTFGRSATETAVRQVRRLARLVDSMLDDSRIVAGRLELVPVDVDLARLVDEVVAYHDAERVATGAPLDTRIEARPRGCWDRARVEQVISNLLSNALKYGAGRQIIVTVSDGTGQALVSVRDHGIGIDEAEQARIFERFERGVSARHFGGLGLGLFIARQLAEHMGGSLEVSSQLGAGSTFTLRLPR